MKDKEAFSQLIEENQDLIFKVSSFYTDNEEDQKDLFQEIVIQLWKSFSNFRSEAKISTWVYRIALNTAITQFRKVKKKAEHVPINKVVMNYMESSDPVLEEQIKELYHQIEKLNDLEKGIIFLFLEDRSYEEIARISGLTVSNVGTRISRIKQKLRSKLKLT